ncbi:unnamed protein product [Pleuronectes platessa]|uniref:Uncharacterized protein n=1 Tax=Pleuronectes platessa TaxID=8262 RepID=A0A9N7YQV6_PLEPL|nr:unnamed protein product [Pleuronectes platessa]
MDDDIDLAEAVAMTGLRLSVSVSVNPSLNPILSLSFVGRAASSRRSQQHGRADQEGGRNITLAGPWDVCRQSEHEKLPWEGGSGRRDHRVFPAERSTGLTDNKLKQPPPRRRIGCFMEQKQPDLCVVSSLIDCPGLKLLTMHCVLSEYLLERGEDKSHSSRRHTTEARAALKNRGRGSPHRQTHRERVAP